MSESTVVLPENFTIHHIEQQAIDLKVAFQTDAETMILDASKVETVDTSGLQLMLALVKTAIANSKTVQWQNPSEVFVSSATRIGLAEKLQLP